MIDRHTDKATAVARDTGWQLTEDADEREWAGIGLGPVGQTRDSEELGRSNWEVIHGDLSDRFGDDIDIARFGHWACGWIEELIWNTGNADLRAAVQTWRDKLENYPIADEEHYSELEHSELMDYFSDEITRHELPDTITPGDVARELMEFGDVSRADDCTESAILEAIAAATETAAIKAATPPDSQLQLVNDHGRPHTGV